MGRLSLAVTPFLCFLLFSGVCAGKLHIYYACTIIIVNILHFSVCVCGKESAQRRKAVEIASHGMTLKRVPTSCLIGASVS